MTIGQKNSVVPNGHAIRKDRQKKDLSQEALAANSDRRFSLSTIKRAEEGRRVSKEKLIYIAAALGHSPEKYISQSSENLNPNINAEDLRLGLLRFISLDEIRSFFGFLIATSIQNKDDTIQEYIFAEILKEIDKNSILSKHYDPLGDIAEDRHFFEAVSKSKENELKRFFIQLTEEIQTSNNETVVELLKKRVAIWESEIS